MTCGGGHLRFCINKKTFNFIHDHAAWFQSSLYILRGTIFYNFPIGFEGINYVLQCQKLWIYNQYKTWIL
jgi:hypothetical protein